MSAEKPRLGSLWVCAAVLRAAMQRLRLQLMTLSIVAYRRRTFVAIRYFAASRPTQLHFDALF